MITKFIILTPFVLLLTATSAFPQPELANGYAIQHFTDENGLPQNSINDLLFDSNGYLWLASQVGLVRFNGNTFDLYYPDDKPAMESNITYLATDDQGAIYFQTDDHNLYRYDGNISHLVKAVNTATLKKSFLINARRQFFDFTAFLRNVTGPEADRRKQIFQHLFDHNEDFYVAGSGRVYLVYKDSLFFYNGKDLLPLTGRAGPDTKYLQFDRKLYLLEGYNVAAVYENGLRTAGNSPIIGNWRGLSPAYTLFSRGNMTHLLANHRLYRIRPAENGRLQADSIANLDFIPMISAVEYNPGLDLLLIATPTEGFYFLRRNNFTISGWSAGLRQALAGHPFGPLVLKGDNEIVTDWFAFRADGWFQRAKDTSAFWQRCLYIDRHNQLWGALNNLPRRLTADLNTAALLPALDANIIAYQEDSAGRLYCLTERSLWRLEPDGFHRLYTQPPDGSDYTAFAPAGFHRFWLASNTGLLLYDEISGSAGPVPELSNKQTRAIHICRDGSILVGTYGQGYYYCYHGRWLQMPADKSDFLVTAHCFLEDRHSMIWISSNKGLFKVPKADIDAFASGATTQVYYYYYGRQDGLLTNEFNGGFNSCGVITPEGFVSLLSMKGTVCFYTDSLQTDFPHGTIDMTHLEIDNQAVERSDTITPAAGYNNLTAEISCPYLGDRNNLYLEYNLKGLNEEWKEVPADGVVSLSRLAPGTYLLRVRKVNGFGKDNYQYRNWTIIVPPLFYKTTTFLAGVMVIALIFLILYVRSRLKLAEKKKEVRLKQETLSETVTQLKDTVARLQESEQALLMTSAQREKLISLVIHDLRSPLRFLTMLAGDLHDNQAALSPAEIRERAYLVKKGALDIYNFSDDFLLWITSQKDNFRISSRLFPIRPLLQEITDFFSEQVQQRGNQLSAEAEEDLRVYSDPHVLITIIRNLVDNANKYTSQGLIRLTATRQGSNVLISISDTGQGMTPRQIAAFLGEDDLDNVNSGSQLGHKFIFDLTRRLNGVLSVESEENKGTRVTLLLPGGAP
ncbi:MAG TPA: ATP-binding protein [Puia sp.]|jgi:signal transduction histidine kinase|nr:ATP-binding protein [Puia sp.]